jgi:two-component flavin-dependent monooxygenase/oxygenase LndZ5
VTTVVGGSSLLDNAQHVAALAGRHAVTAEARRSPHPEVLGSLVASGFTRHFVPRRFGGAEGGFADLKAAVSIIGAECPATAWCSVLAGLMARTAGYLPPEGQRQVWSTGPDAFVVGGFAPRGTAEPVTGGWLLSGTWPLVTTAEYADWALLAARVAGDAVTRIFVVSRTAMTVESTWDDIGMRATGSHTVRIDQVFVPVWMSFPFTDITEVRQPPVGSDGRAVPMLAVNVLVFCLPMLGAARGALAHWERFAAAKLHTSDGSARAHLSGVYGRSSSEIDAAELILDRIIEVVDTAPVVTDTEVVRNTRDCAFAAELLVDAVDRLMRTSGSNGHSTSQPLQRLWRDIHTAGAHAALQFGPAAVAYTTHHLTSPA